VPWGSGVRIGLDRDEDGHYNRADNCPSVFNPQQTDANDDGVGDVCEPGATTTTTTTTTLPTTTTTTMPSVDTLEIETLQVSGLSRAAGDQKLKLKTGELPAAGFAFDPALDALNVVVERAPGAGLTTVIPAGAAGWRVSRDGRRFKWKAPKAAPPSALRALSLSFRGDSAKLRATSQEIDASWAAGATMLGTSLEIGSGRWLGVTPPCTASASSIRCR
jgi:hypothetical protein